MGANAVVAGSAAPTASVAAARRLAGSIELPGDKSISHRALLLALLARGETRIRGASDGGDVRSTAGIAGRLGAKVEVRPIDGGNVDVLVVSPGRSELHSPDGSLDCGNSGTTMRLLAGVLAGVPGEAVLDGDASLRTRPMARVIEPLRAMGAEVRGSGADGTRPPIRVVGARELRAIDHAPPVASAQVKSAILLAGLAADGTTVVRESVATRDHTERMLRERGVTVRSTGTDDGGVRVELDGPASVRPTDQAVPADVSAAAFWLVAGAIHPDAGITLRAVGVNPTRRAVIDLLRRMGASIEERGEPDDGVGEPIADLVVRSSSLDAIELSATDTASAIDEIPILCLAASQAHGRTVIRAAGELRHKESDRIAGIATGLGRLGARIEVHGDDLVVTGPTVLRGAEVDSLGDHRLSMTFAIAGLVASGRTTIAGANSASISYTGFYADLERIRA